MSAYTTVIDHVGSHFPGTQLNPEDEGIPHLLYMLTEYPLDPRFEDYGNFLDRSPEWLPGVEMPPGTASLFGNFATYSCGFMLRTNDPELIDVLEEAMRNNQASDAYQQARAERLARKAARAAAVDAEQVARAAAQVEARNTYELAMRRRGF